MTIRARKSSPSPAEPAPYGRWLGSTGRKLVTPPPLVRVWRGGGGRRRLLLVALVGLGLGQAAVTVVVTQLLPVLLATPDPMLRIGITAAALAGVLGVGVGRRQERVVAERLGQDCAHEVRLRLLDATLREPGRTSLGVTIARASNDLSMVRNWVCLGLAPLLTGIPILVGAAVALALLAPAFAVAALVPVALLAVVLALLSGPTYRRARELRRRRGRLAARVADAAAAAPTIAAAGGVDRELRHLDASGRELSDAAVDRARATGAMRGAAAAASASATVGVVVVAAWAGLDPTLAVAAFPVIGLIVGPVTDLGRVGEHRQNQRAAAAVLGPVIEAGERRRQQEEARRDLPARQHGGMSRGVVHVGGLRHRGGPVPDLVGRPGERIVVDPADLDVVGPALAMLVWGAAPGTADAWATIDGWSLTRTPAERRRALVGHSARGLSIERGTIARAVRYRVPSSAAAVAPTLARAELTEVIGRLPKRERTRLTAGGAPLEPAERARLQLARAFHDDPPLVVLDRVTDDLDTVGVRALGQLLDHHRGVALVVTDRPELVGPHRRWTASASVASSKPPASQEDPTMDAAAAPPRDQLVPS